MQPGTLLRIYQALRRVGIQAEVGTVPYNPDTIRIVTRKQVALYTHAEAEQLAEEARTWHVGQDEEDLLW
jgi:hypothetical protein